MDGSLGWLCVMSQWNHKIVAYSAMIVQHSGLVLTHPIRQLLIVWTGQKSEEFHTARILLRNTSTSLCMIILVLV
jgi:hypothetical protein